MDLASQYEICSPGVIAENFDGDIVILNLEDGRYFSLRGCGGMLWSALMAGATPQAIVDSAHRDCPALADSTRTFMHSLCEMQLIRPTGSKGHLPSVLAIDWKSASTADCPAVDVFDDLADLILADPVHDVDAEAGWPNRKAA